MANRRIRGRRLIASLCQRSPTSAQEIHAQEALGEEGKGYNPMEASRGWDLELEDCAHDMRSKSSLKSTCTRAREGRTRETRTAHPFRGWIDGERVRAGERIGGKTWSSRQPGPAKRSHIERERSSHTPCGQVPWTDSCAPAVVQIKQPGTDRVNERQTQANDESGTSGSPMFH